MSVEVIYAEVARAWRVEVADAAGSSVGALLARLPTLTKGWPPTALSPAAVAVFGREVDVATVLRDGDRLELLRALPNDPKLARRARAGR